MEVFTTNKFIFFFNKRKDVEGNIKSFIKVVLLIEKLEKLMGGSPFLQAHD